MEIKECTITTTFSYYWTPGGLVIESDSTAARDYIARLLEEKEILIKVKNKK